MLARAMQLDVAESMTQNIQIVNLHLNIFSTEMYWNVGSFKGMLLKLPLWHHFILGQMEKVMRIQIHRIFRSTLW